MRIAIIGLPNSGKTTVFNALTGASAETAAFSSGQREPNLAAVKVPDRRVDALTGLYSPRKVTYAEVQYVDIAGLSGVEKRDALAPEIIRSIGTADAFLHVVRVFESDSVSHPFGGVDLHSDVVRLDQELMLNDLVVVERRLERLEKDLRRLPPGERTVRELEQRILGQFRSALEAGTPLRDMGTLPEQQEKLVRGFQFLSAKPVLILLNAGEHQAGKTLEFGYRHRGSGVVTLSGKLEEELTHLSSEDAMEFMAELGIEESARDRVIAASYRLLNLVSFLTVGEDEVRAWTIRFGTKAAQAGGVIHSDIERGFIRAEIVGFDDLMAAGSMASARKQGLVRMEGKDYTIQDGDIIHFLFNV